MRAVLCSTAVAYRPLPNAGAPSLVRDERLLPCLLLMLRSADLESIGMGSR